MSAQRREMLLKKYRSDYEEVIGKAFEHFFCPILYVDQPAELCLGHVVNDAIEGSSKEVVLQRKDIDNFYGYAFEADFAAFLELEKSSLEDTVIDPDLNRKARPRMEMDGQPIEMFPYHGSKSKRQILVQTAVPDGRSRDFVMKIDEKHLADLENRSFEMVVDQDYRIPALVSLLKAAHLSLFHQLGYQYVFNAGAQYLGNGILGEFFRQAGHLEKMARASAARRFFTPLCNMVRPLLAETTGFRGFIDDGLGYVCLTGEEKPFALGVIIRTGEDLHSVILPADPTAIDTYFSFLREPPPSVAIRTVKWDRDCWSGSKEILRVPFTNAFA